MQTASRDELRERAQSLAKVFRDRAAEWDQTEEYPFPNVADLAEAGLMGMTIPVEYGGPGISLRDVVMVIEEVAKGCGTTGRIVVDSNMGALGCVMAYGSDELKRHVAGLVLAGDKPVIQITEPDAGTDALNLQTTAVVADGRITLNGEKTWITGARDSVVNVVVARVVRDGEDLGIGAVYVERDTPGYVLGRRRYMMGLRGIPEMQVLFQDCTVPEENLLVVGFSKIMSAYNAQRCGAAAVALGIAQSAFDLAVAYLLERRQFGRPLAEFQGLQWRMVDAALALDASRLLIERAATEVGEDGFPHQELAARAKLFTAEMAVRVSNEALQMHGALGYSREVPLERLVRDARMFAIGGGTTEALRNVCAKQVFGRSFDQRR